MKTYRGKISYLLLILIFPALFTIAVILDATFYKQPFSTSVFLFWVPFIPFIFIPLGYKLEVGSDFISNSFLGFNICKLYSYNIESINYGGMGIYNSVYPGRAIIHGNGLAILTNVSGVKKVYGFSEKLYGKEAIEHINSIFKNNYDK